MPVKERKPFAFDFEYNGKIYHFATYVLYREDEYICNVDLTATEYYGNKDITLMCCKIAIEAYESGVQDGAAEFRRQFKDFLFQ